MSDSNQRTACKQCGGKIDVDALACPNCGEPRAPSPDRRFEGVEISGKYLVKSRIARGGMGEVYRAEHKEMRQSVAVKFLHRRFADDAGFAQRFLNEARYAGRVSHPNAVRLFDFGKLDDGTLYMIMEFVRGRSLTDIVDELQMLPINMAVRVAAQVAEVLASAHELRIIHRDVKPDNIMLVRTPGGRFSVKVLDFGIAKVLDESDSMQTETGVMFGTPEYMSPEQASGKKVDQRSDVYSLGLVLYFMLAGSPPFHGKNKLRIIHQQAREEPDPVEMRARQPLPPVLIDLIREMLSKDPEGRPQRMLEVFRRLEELELRETSSFEEARSQSAVFKIGDGNDALEALPTARTDQSAAASSSSSDGASPRSRTAGFATRSQSDAPEISQRATNPATRDPNMSRPDGRSADPRIDRPNQRYVAPSSSGAHVSSDGLRPLGHGQITGVSASNTQRRQLGDRGPLRDFAARLPVTASHDDPGMGKKSGGHVAVLVALFITLACIGAASWYGIKFYEADEESSLLTLSSPESLHVAASQALEAEQAADTQIDEADATETAVDAEPTRAQERSSARRETNTGTRRANQNTPPAEQAAVAVADSSFSDGIGRAQVLIASARVDEAREQLRGLEPSGEQQTQELSAVREQLTRIEQLHTRLGAALESGACGDAERVASELSSVGGSHHLSRWRAQIRSCEQPAAPANQPPSVQPTQPAPSPQTRPAQPRQPASEQPANAAPSDTGTSRATEPQNGSGGVDAPGGLPRDLEAPAQRPPVVEEPTPAPSRSDPAPPSAEPERTQPRAPAPVMPPSEL